MADPMTREEWADAALVLERLSKPCPSGDEHAWRQCPRCLTIEELGHHRGRIFDLMAKVAAALRAAPPAPDVVQVPRCAAVLKMRGLASERCVRPHDHDHVHEATIDGVRWWFDDTGDAGVFSPSDLAAEAALKAAPPADTGAPPALVALIDRVRGAYRRKQAASVGDPNMQQITTEKLDEAVDDLLAWATAAPTEANHD